MSDMSTWAAGEVVSIIMADVGESAWVVGASESVDSIAIVASVDTVVSKGATESTDVSVTPQPADNSIVAADSRLIAHFVTFLILPPLF
jgi:hypothetical protein